LSEPKLLREDVNTKYRETHATITPDGNAIFFTSDRKEVLAVLILCDEKLPTENGVVLNYYQIK
jgi:hypothetical protein